MKTNHTATLYQMVRGHEQQHKISDARAELIYQDPVKAFTTGMVYQDSPQGVFDATLASNARKALYALPQSRREEIQSNAKDAIKSASGSLHFVEKHQKYLELPAHSLERALYEGIEDQKFVTREGPCAPCTDLLTIVDSLKVLDALFLDEDRTMGLQWGTLGDVLTEFVYS